MSLYGGVETGGTKCACIIANSPEEIYAEVKFLTAQPDVTIGRIIDFFLEKRKTVDAKIRGIGIASFGPIDIDPSSKTYGNITSTPKNGWQDINLVQSIERALQIPVVFDTDTNGAASGEWLWGAAQGLSDFLYLTIGTGIGGGGFCNGKPVHGLVHPEIGHMRIPHDFSSDPFVGTCPFHKDCFEGMASGPAVEKRWRKKGINLPIDHPAWELEAEYLALGLHNLVCSFSPQKIILGGGVMQQTQLFPMIREKLQRNLAGYIQTQKIIEDISSYVVPPGLENRAGILGAVALAKIQNEGIITT